MAPTTKQPADSQQEPQSHPGISAPTNPVKKRPSLIKMGVLCMLVGMGLKYYFDEVFDVWSGVGRVISGGGRVGGPGYSTLEHNRFIWQAGSKIGGLGIGLGFVLIIVGGIARQSDCTAGQPKITNDKE